ncbi:hypothetical protein Tco_0771311 [Tanacetum coccineum]|uniref:Uncharacterized protein n=1 Tax=Tanacetum coccineum TaxID=301880 RepID=A0ABQ4ZI09_9ASTR
MRSARRVIYGCPYGRGRRIADIDQDFDVFLVHHDACIQGRYEDISTAEFNISTAKPVSTAGVAVTTASVSTAEPKKPSKKKDQVKADEELAKRLEEEMQAELEEEARIERIAQEEASIVALIAEFDDKLEDDTEKEELKAYLDIVPGDEIAMEVESLATEYPIVDWKTHILSKNMMYYQIIRADGSSSRILRNLQFIVGKMLDDF